MAAEHAGHGHSGQRQHPREVQKQTQEHREHYTRLFAMAALSFGFMYVLMYAMVDRFPNALTNLNQLYMAGLMAAPMVLIEMVLMRGMYASRKLNAAILGATIIAGLTFFVLIRKQGAVGDEQFLRSMIPHHSGAILMCEEAEIEDADVRDLCSRIIESQEAEISEMKAKLADLSANRREERTSSREGAVR